MTTGRVRGVRHARRRVAGRTVGVICSLALALPVVGSTAAPVAALDPTVSFSSIPLASWTVNGTGRAVLKVGNTVYVGGAFSQARSPDGTQSVNRANLAAFDATTGALITGFRADTNATIRNIQTDGSSLFIAGSFTTVGGVSRQRIAKLDPVTGAVDPSFVANTNGTVWNLSLGGGKLYVAGTFSTVNGSSRSRIAAVSPSTGVLDASFTPSADATVRAIAASPDGSTVYVGGPYDAINGTSASNITTLDATTGAIVGPPLSGVTGYVDDLEVTADGENLLAAHSGFPGIGNRSAVYDTATGNRRWRHVVDGDVQGIHSIGGMVFSGFHDGANGDGASRVAGYDLLDGEEDVAFHPSFDRFMGAYAVDGDHSALVIAGDFSTISGVDVEGFAIFPAGAPTPFVASVWGWETWRYLDDGSNQGTAWRQPGFDDSSWDTGVGAFGYGNEHRTQISYGPSWSDKYITTYFRKTFQASAVPAAAAIYMRVDDGAVVYVNGVEAARDNLPSGPINHLTLAFDRSGNSEGSSRYFEITPSLLVAGTNTIAVEVHQSSPSSDDLTFFPTVVAYGATSNNVAPTAVIGATPLAGDRPLPVSFDGGASTDPDGSIVSWAWDFGDGSGGASGSTASHTYTAAGNYTATLTVTDDDGAIGVATETINVTDPPPGGDVDLPPTAVWAYLDDGSDQGTAWRSPGFDDSSWATGVGEFGYGDGDENTIISYGPAGNAKYRTTYFRATFDATGVPNDLTLTMRVDDGAVAYLNGVEVVRFNLPGGEIDYRTKAVDDITGADEQIDRPFAIDPALVVAGANVLAVEVHQRGNFTPDMSFLAWLETPEPTPPPPSASVDVPPSATWAYLDDGSDQGSSWRQLGFDDSSWATGVGEFGYGDGDENTVVSFGPDGRAKYRTTYFRHAFTTTGVPNDLTLTMRVDDGAVAYLNGVEVARFNLPDGEIDYRTKAVDDITGPDELVDRPFAIDPSLIAVGPNVLAVEVHQRGNFTPDMSFLASLAGAGGPPAGAEVDVAPTATWSYLDDGSDQGVAWQALGFDDSSWATGVGEFGYGDGDENTVVSYGPDPNDKYQTTYFRTGFSAAGAPSDLTLTMRIDDGAVAYLNGVEIARFNMPAGPINHLTDASSSIFGSEEELDRPFSVDPSLVQVGTNVLAVEVHQRGSSSSDLTFLASLFGNA